MASKTAQTQYRRMIRNKNAGKSRKRSLQNKGSTPAFAIHTEAADKNAPKEQISPDKRG